MFDDTNCNLSPKIMTVLLLGVMFTAGLLLSSGLVVGQTTTDPAVDAQPTAVIQARFILWDEYEKSIDKHFEILLLSWSNVSMNYSVRIDATYYNGSFYQYHKLNYTMVNTTKIHLLVVSINNQTVMHATDIRVVVGITQSGIDNIQEPYKISFLPFELTKFEWNLVFSGIVAVLISLPTSYFTVKYYRKHRGATVM